MNKQRIEQLSRGEVGLINIPKASKEQLEELFKGTQNKELPNGSSTYYYRDGDWWDSFDNKESLDIHQITMPFYNISWFMAEPLQVQEEPDKKMFKVRLLKSTFDEFKKGDELLVSESDTFTGFYSYKKDKMTSYHFPKPDCEIIPELTDGIEKSNDEFFEVLHHTMGSIKVKDTGDPKYLFRRNGEKVHKDQCIKVGTDVEEFIEDEIDSYRILVADAEKLLADRKAILRYLESKHHS